MTYNQLATVKLTALLKFVVLVALVILVRHWCGEQVAAAWACVSFVAVAWWTHRVQGGGHGA